MAIYYHLTNDLQHDGHFEPRIPVDIMADEDNLTPRICVSNSVEGCAKSVPWSSSMSNDTIYKLFEIDTDKLDIGQEYIIDNETLIEKGLVPDANNTGERWILKLFIVKGKLIQINGQVDEQTNTFICEEINAINNVGILKYGDNFKLAVPKTETFTLEMIDYINNHYDECIKYKVIKNESLYELNLKLKEDYKEVNIEDIILFRLKLFEKLQNNYEMILHPK